MRYQSTTSASFSIGRHDPSEPNVAHRRVASSTRRVAPAVCSRAGTHRHVSRHGDLCVDRQVFTCLLSVQVGDVYKALADPTRRRILDELTERNGQTLFEICARLATKHQLASSRQAISQHLELLQDAGLIETRRDGRFKFHYLNPQPLEHIADRWLRPDPKETE